MLRRNRRGIHRGFKKVGLGYTDFMPVRGQAQNRPMTQEAHDFRGCPTITLSNIKTAYFRQ